MWIHCLPFSNYHNKSMIQEELYQSRNFFNFDIINGQRIQNCKDDG